MTDSGLEYFPQPVPARCVVGRLGVDPGPTEAIPFETLASFISPALSRTTADLLTAYPAPYSVAANFVVNTGGRTAVNDGGGSSFFYDATDTTSADNGGTIRVDGAGRRWRQLAGGIVSPPLFGADRTGTNDSAAALNAMSTWLGVVGGKGWVPIGTYKIASPWVCPNNITITGEDWQKSIIKPTSAVTTVAVDFSGASAILERIFIDGEDTTGVIGLRFGGAGLSSDGAARFIIVYEFTGSGGKGVQVKDIVRGRYTEIYSTENQENWDLGSTANSNYCTDLLFDTCSAHSSSGGAGWAIKQCIRATFIKCLSEGNQQAAWDVNPKSANVVSGLNWIGGWCEANWLSLASGAARHAEFHMKFTGTTHPVLSPTIDNMYFNGDINNCSAIHFDTVLYFYLRNVAFQQLSGAIVVDGATSFGWGEGLQGYANFITVNAGELRIMDRMYDAWTTYAPTFTSDLGNEAATFDSAPTVNAAKTRQVGQTLDLRINVTGTSHSGTGPTYIEFTLPGSLVPKDAYIETPCSVGDDGVKETGTIRSTASKMRVYRADDAVFTAGAPVTFSVVIPIELA